MTCYAYTDGASRGNPGESGIGLIVKDEHGNTLLKLNGYIGRTTNNIAEYTALLALLRRMRGTPCSRLVVHSDSELMVRQVNGEYKVKDQNLKELHKKVSKLLGESGFRFELKHISREENRDADRLANIGIEERKLVRI
jgi:ribonuclease HI